MVSLDRGESTVADFGCFHYSLLGFRLLWGHLLQLLILLVLEIVLVVGRLKCDKPLSRGLVVRFLCHLLVLSVVLYLGWRLALLRFCWGLPLIAAAAASDAYNDKEYKNHQYSE